LEEGAEAWRRWGRFGRLGKVHSVHLGERPRIRHGKCTSTPAPRAPAARGVVQTSRPSSRSVVGVSAAVKSPCTSSPSAANGVTSVLASATPLPAPRSPPAVTSPHAAKTRAWKQGTKLPAYSAPLTVPPPGAEVAAGTSARPSIAAENAP